MTEYDIKRLALVLAVQAEIEGMKALNQQRGVYNESVGYCQSDFSSMADQLNTIAHKHDHEL